MNPAIEKLEKGIQRCEKNPATFLDPEGIKPILESLKACVEALEEVKELQEKQSHELCTCYENPEGSCKYCNTGTRIVNACDKALTLVNRAMGVSHE